MFLSLNQLAERWGVRPKVIYALRYRREAPPAVRIGRELRFSLRDIEAWEVERRERDHAT